MPPPLMRFPHIQVLLPLCILALSVLCSGQSPQSRYLAYSTYNPQPNTASSAAVNSTGELCVGSTTELYQLRADGSLAYDKSITSIDYAAIAIDASGNCYIATANFTEPPMTVSKYDSQGNLVFKVDYAGSGPQSPSGMAVDGLGNIWLAGTTSSTDLQTVNPIQAILKGQQDAFVAEFNSAGALIFSTYFGGNDNDSAASLALDADGNAYFVGTTSSSDFPMMNPLEPSPTGSGSAFLTKIDGAGHLLYSTYLGQNVGPGASGVAVDASMNMYVKSMYADPPFRYGHVAAKLNATGSAIVYAIYVGGGDGGDAGPITVDSQGNAYTSACIQEGLNYAPCPFPAPVDPIQSDGTTGWLIGLDPIGNVIFLTPFGIYAGNSVAAGFLHSIGMDSVGNLYTDAWATTDMYVPLNVPLLNAVNGVYPGSGSFVAKIALGAGASFSMPATLNFPTTSVGLTTGLIPYVGGSAQIYNTGTTNIAINNIAISGDFSQTNNCPATLAAATSCALTITFDPTAVGTRAGAVTITDNSPGSPHLIQLTGLGTAGPAVTLSPPSLIFAAQPVGTTSASQAANVIDSGQANLSITQWSISGDFAETLVCGNPIAPGEYCTFLVTFAPTATGLRRGTISVTDNATGSPQTISLSGTGEAPGLALGVASGNSSSASVTAGDTATYKLTIGGQAIGGTATLSCTGAPAGANCSVPPSVSVSATTASTVAVTVATAPHISAFSVRPGRRLEWLWAMAFLALVFLPGLSAGKRLRPRALLFGLLILVCSCGGGSSPPPSNQGGTPAGIYALTVTANLGSSNQSVPLTLTVR